MTPLEKAARALATLPCRCFGTTADAAELDRLRRREAVRAVLIAIREPSKHMVDVGDDFAGTLAISHDCCAKGTWVRMIDTLLKEGA